MEFHDLLYACLETLREDDSGLEDLCSRHPEHADRLRREVARLRRLGLLGVATREPAMSTPERLGGFRLLELLGEGGMGLVYAAEETALGRTVALKMVRPAQLHFPGARERFRREVATVARLQHAGIVPVYAVGEDDGVPYFTMELLDGCTLAHVVAAMRGRDPAKLTGRDLATAIDGASPAVRAASPVRGALFEGSWLDACVTIARDVAEALDYAHGRGLVHRDVKPSNVAITRSGRAMLLDFGLAQVAEADRLTASGGLTGSLPYMSPEQLAGGELDGRTDVYSLGLTLYELAGLEPAFRGSSVTVAQLVARGEFEPPRTHNRAMPRDLETVVLTAAARDRTRRYASAGDLARDLGHVLARRPIEASRPGPVLRAIRWAQRNPKTSAAAVAAVPLALVALGALAWVERTRKAEILRLADVRRVSDLEAESEALWPPHPERIADYEAWLTRAEQLVARLPLHKATLASLAPANGAVLAAGAARSDAADDVRWQQDTLGGLIAGLERWQEPDLGLLASVRARLAFARTVREATVDGAAASALWSAAIRSIGDARECPAYGGLAIRPQLGLLPVGRDAATGLWEFAHLQSGVAAQRGDDGRLALTPETGIVFVLLPGGRFRMGSVRDEGDPEYDPHAIPEEEPVHEVELAPFFCSKHLVDQAQWERATGLRAQEPLLPASAISWDEASRELAHQGLAIPTEAQFEYAARAGTRTPWWTGATRETLAGAANLLDTSVVRANGGKAGGPYEAWLDDGFENRNPVDAMRANPFGIHDVVGNLGQWCRDAYASYETAPRAGDGERANPKNRNRVLRGASCANTAEQARSAHRAAMNPASKTWILGVRASRALDL